MSVTGTFIDATEALRIGLVNHVVDHDKLLPFALSLAARIPLNTAVTEMLSLYRHGQDLTLAAALSLETTSSIGRKYDLAAFTAAGSKTAANQRKATTAEGNS
jgi:enoyl-CoA hydratase